jgi:threonine dehydrogenase-like Zn-dependent dehydrogenase
VKARALWFVGPERVEIREEEILPGPGETVISSTLMGISHGTEMLLYRGQMPPDMETDAAIPALSGTAAYPLKYGYINVGIDDGDRRVFAFFPHQDFFALPASQLISLPGTLGDTDAVFLAHMETAVSIVHDAHPLIGEWALVLGQGTVGLLASELLIRSGARVISVEPSDIRREESVRIGCTALTPREGAIREQVRDLTGGRGVDLAVNVSGSRDALQAGIDALSMEGRLVEASWYGSREVRLHLGESFHRKRLRIISSQVSTIAAPLSAAWDKRRRLDLVIDLLQSIRPSRYISRSFPLEDAAKAFELIHRDTGDTIQVVLTPGSRE